MGLSRLWWHTLFWAMPFVLFAQMASGESFTSKDHDYVAVTLARGLDRPWGMAFLPGVLISLMSAKTVNCAKQAGTKPSQPLPKR